MLRGGICAFSLKGSSTLLEITFTDSFEVRQTRRWMNGFHRLLSGNPVIFFSRPARSLTIRPFQGLGDHIKRVK
jgi:hypothetical protein